MGEHQDIRSTPLPATAGRPPVDERRVRRTRAEERVYRVLGIVVGGGLVGLVVATLGTWLLEPLGWGCSIPAGDVDPAQAGVPVCDGDWRRGTFLGLGVLGTLSGIVLVAVLASRGRRLRALVAWGGSVAALVAGVVAASLAGSTWEKAVEGCTSDPFESGCAGSAQALWVGTLVWAAVTTAGVLLSNRLARRVPVRAVAR